jgi:putative aldouronate transport system permease protein
MQLITKSISISSKVQEFSKKVVKDLKRNKYKYLMILPVILYYVLFMYKPMYGVIIAFKNYSPALGINNSPWVGLKHFSDFINNIYFYRILSNTFIISFYDILFGFSAPIILALLLNEIHNKHFKNTVQTITYLPHFISLIVICSIIKEFTVTDGLINDIVAFFGGQRVSLLQKSEYFRTIFVSTNIWQQVGWSSIIYLSALAAIDVQLYEAATVDGAGKFSQLINITLPSILPTIIIMLILRIGQIMNVGFEKIILLYNSSTYETADVIASYVYRMGLQDLKWSYASAIGLFNSVINFAFLIVANWLSKKTSENSMW